MWRSDRKILLNIPIEIQLYPVMTLNDSRHLQTEIVPFFFELRGTHDAGLFLFLLKKNQVVFPSTPRENLYDNGEKATRLKMYLPFEMVIVHLAMLLEGICMFHQRFWGDFFWGPGLLKGQENLILQIFQLRKRQEFWTDTRHPVLCLVSPKSTKSSKWNHSRFMRYTYLYIWHIYIYSWIPRNVKHMESAGYLWIVFSRNPLFLVSVWIPWILAARSNTFQVWRVSGFGVWQGGHVEDKKRMDHSEVNTFITRWWYHVFFFLPLLLGEMIQFDEHIFQWGWNHQLDHQNRFHG